MKKLLILILFLLITPIVFSETAVIRTNVNLTATNINGTGCEIKLKTPWEEFIYSINNNSIEEFFDVVNPYEFRCLLDKDNEGNETDLLDACAKIINEDYIKKYQEVYDSYNNVTIFKQQCDEELAECTSQKGNYTTCETEKKDTNDLLLSCNNDKTAIQKEADQKELWGLIGIGIGIFGYWIFKVRKKSTENEETKLVGDRELEREN